MAKKSLLPRRSLLWSLKVSVGFYSKKNEKKEAATACCSKAFLSCIPNRLFSLYVEGIKKEERSKEVLLFPLKKKSKTKVTFLTEFSKKGLSAMALHFRPRNET